MLRVAGIVLCGGQSRRMGQPKAWLPIGNETMLGRIVRLLGTVVSPLVLVAQNEQSLPSLADPVEIVRDLHPDRGPLEGLATGMDALAGWADAAFVCACDAPLLRADFVRLLIDRLGSWDACVPEVDGQRHPLAAVYRVSVARTARNLLAERGSRMMALIDQLQVRFVGPEELQVVDPHLHSLLNLNTPQEFEAARSIAERFGRGGSSPPA